MGQITRSSGKSCRRCLRGKTVLLTGTAGGMGLAVAKLLTEKGCRVYGLDLRRPAPLAGLHYIQTDLTDPASVEKAFALLRERKVRLDGIVHMAGLYDLNSLVEIDEAAWERIFQVNLCAAYRVNRIFLPLLRPGARIILTTSELAPLDPLPFTGIYAVTKAALDKYASSLRMELQLLGIRVIVLRPGAVDTKLLDVSTKRLEDFVRNTAWYAPNAVRFRQVVDRVEARKIPPERIAELTERALRCEHPRDVYTINRNPLLLLLNALPNRLQREIIRVVLKK